MRKQVLETIKNYGLLSRGDRCILAVSGGADSMALLYILNSLKDELDISLRAVHVHHGLRGAEADRDARWVKENCDSLGIPCEIRYVDVKSYVRETGDSVEEAARILRYRELFDAAAGWDAETGVSTSGGNVEPMMSTSGGDAEAKIAVAHNMGDNAETILMQMARGSGLKGLGGIDRKNGRIIRPLLEVKRSQLEEYLTGLGVSWVTDSTNLDDDYTRNRIRHKILPELEAGVNSAAAEHIAAAGNLISQAYEYIRGEAEKLIAEYADFPGVTLFEAGPDIGKSAAADQLSHGAEMVQSCRFPAEVLRAQAQILRSTVVMLLLGRVCGTQKDISAVHIGDVVSLMDKKTGKYIMLPYGLRARREYGYICIERRTADEGYIHGRKSSADDGYIQSRKSADDGYLSDQKSEDGTGVQEDGSGADRFGTKRHEPDTDDLQSRFKTRIFDYSGETVPTGEYTKWFDYDKIFTLVSFRYRAPGDYIVLGKTGRKSIASYMTDRKIPGGQRDLIPLVADGSHVIWIVGYRISEAYKITEATTRVLEITYCADAGRRKDAVDARTQRQVPGK